MSLYAIKGNSFRAIASPSDALAGEVVSNTIPQSLLDQVAADEAFIAGNDATLRTQAEGAMDSLRAFRDLASPTNAQVIAVVKLLCRVALGLIRWRSGKLDATD